MAGNNIKTQGYFIKRMRDSGYVVSRMFSGYDSLDTRAWTVMIDPGGASVFCTCYINEQEDGEFQPGSSYFEFFDGGRYIPGRIKIRTSSFEIVVEQLVKWGINEKSKNYNNEYKNDVDG